MVQAILVIDRFGAGIHFFGECLAQKSREIYPITNGVLRIDIFL